MYFCNLKLYVLMGILILCGATSRADGTFYYFAESTEQDVQLRPFFYDTLEKLPKLIRRSLTKPIKVRFAKLPKHRIARIESKLFGEPEILLNNYYLPAALNRSTELTIPIISRHKSAFDIIQAGLIHETAHYYDQWGQHPPRIQNLYNDLSKLCLTATHDQVRAKACRQAEPLVRQVSSRPDFIGAAHFAKGTIFKDTIAARNRRAERLPDEYELTDIQEVFATNLEFFLLDPDYRCRRPVLYSYFENRFQHIPFVDASCEIDTRAIAYSPEQKLSQSDMPPLVVTDLDPHRVYEIHLLHAKSGDTLASKWGHSMFRVIMCAPKRELTGPECLNDIAYHVVISFRANVHDVVIDNWKGLTGGYPSQLFLLPMIDVVNEYTKVELRDMESIPLALSQDEQEHFLFSVLEHHWMYRGAYGFINTNCATESYWLLRSVLRDTAFTQTDAPGTPQGLRELLKTLGRLDESRLTTFKSNESVLEHTQQELGISKFEALTPSQHRELFFKKLKERPNQTQKTAAQFYVLGTHYHRILERKIVEEVLRMVEPRKLSAILAYDPLLQVGNKNSYGIPLRDEIDQYLTTLEKITDGRTINSDLIREISTQIDLNDFKLSTHNLLEYRRIMLDIKKTERKL